MLLLGEKSFEWTFFNFPRHSILSFGIWCYISADRTPATTFSLSLQIHANIKFKSLQLTSTTHTFKLNTVKNNNVFPALNVLFKVRMHQLYNVVSKLRGHGFSRHCIMNYKKGGFPCVWNGIVHSLCHISASLTWQNKSFSIFECSGTGSQETRLRCCSASSCLVLSYLVSCPLPSTEVVSSPLRLHHLKKKHSPTQHLHVGPTFAPWSQQGLTLNHPSSPFITSPSVPYTRPQPQPF